MISKMFQLRCFYTPYRWNILAVLFPTNVETERQRDNEIICILILSSYQNAKSRFIQKI